MTAVAILSAVLTYGPEVLPLIQQIPAWIESGKSPVTSADIDILVKLGAKTSSDYLTAAGGAPVVPKAP